MKTKLRERPCGDDVRECGTAVGHPVTVETCPLILVGEEDDCMRDACAGALAGRRVTRIRGGLECRRFLRTHQVGMIIVGPNVRDVSPINLIAAISSDMAAGYVHRCPRIYLFDGLISGSLSSRANNAGVTGIIAPRSLGEVLRERDGIGAVPEGRLAGTGTRSAMSAHADTAALEIEHADTAALEMGHAYDEATKLEYADTAALESGRACAMSADPEHARGAVAETERGRGMAAEPHRIRDEAAGLAPAGYEHVDRKPTMMPVSPPAAFADVLPASGKVVSFVSGNGGSGRTTCALLTALMLDRLGMHVALLDLDVQFGDLGCLFGRDDVPALDALIGATGDMDVLRGRIRSMSTAVAGDVVLFSAPIRPERGDLLIPHIGRILDGFRTAFDVIVIDTGSFWNELNAAVLARSDRLIGICDQRASSLQMMSSALDLCARLGVPLVRMEVLLNRCDSKAPIDEVSAQMALKGPKVVSIADGGREVDELIGLGCPDDLIMLKNPCARDLERFVSGLSAELGSQAGPAVEQAEVRKSRRRTLRMFRKGAKA